MTSEPEKELPIVAIIGRPNVGKSSLFNVITGRRISIVHEQSGVTRDRIMAPASCGKRHFLLVDTGGLADVSEREMTNPTFDSLVLEQVRNIIEDAVHLLWVVDSRTGVTALDEEIAGLLRKNGVNVTVVANKADNEQLAETAFAEFSRLGFEKVRPVSCAHRRGVGDCLDDIAASFPPDAGSEALGVGFRLAVVGRPNVGKSAMINTLLGENRVLESDIAGTTRDAVEIPVTVSGEDRNLPLTIIDTAGLRRRRQMDSVVEYFSVQRAENAIRRSDACLLVIDSTQPATSQDKRIARIIAEKYKPCIIAANKWDLAGREVKFQRLKSYIRKQMPFMNYAPISCVCAVSGYNFDTILENLFVLKDQMEVRVPTHILNDFIYKTSRDKPAKAVKGRLLKVYYATFIDNPPPTFLLFVNDPGLCSSQYRRFLENRLKNAFFPEPGMPVRVILRPRRDERRILHKK